MHILTSCESQHNKSISHCRSVKGKMNNMKIWAVRKVLWKCIICGIGKVEPPDDQLHSSVTWLQLTAALWLIWVGTVQTQLAGFCAVIPTPWHTAVLYLGNSVCRPEINLRAVGWEHWQDNVCCLPYDAFIFFFWSLKTHKNLPGNSEIDISLPSPLAEYIKFNVHYINIHLP